MFKNEYWRSVIKKHIKFPVPEKVIVCMQIECSGHLKKMSANLNQHKLNDSVKFSIIKDTYIRFHQFHPKFDVHGNIIDKRL